MDIHNYGEYLQKNKSRISQLADAMYKESNKDPNSGIYPQRKAVMVAIAMLVRNISCYIQQDPLAQDNLQSPLLQTAC